jgi:hypothetical protein
LVVFFLFFGCLGIIEGNVGSIRFFGILRKFRGLCIGRRFLSKIEDLIFQQYKCCRVLISVTNRRTSLVKWVSERGYHHVVDVQYPFDFLHHQPIDFEEMDLIKLSQFVKWNPNREDKQKKKEESQIPPSNDSHLPPIFRRKLPTISDVYEESDFGNEENEDNDTAEVLGVD